MSDKKQSDDVTNAPESGRTERIHFIFGKDMTAEEISDVIVREYKKHFGDVANVDESSERPER